MSTVKEICFRYLLCILFSVYASGFIFAQDFSNRGKDFWVGHMGHIDGTGSNFKLYISSTVNTSGTVSVPLQGWSTNFTITANTFAIISIPSSVTYVGCSDCIEQRGIHIVANDDVAVYAHIYASARSDATLLLPTAAIAKEYYATCYTQSSGHKSEFLVVAPEDSTQVEITPTANTLGGNLANVPFTVNLQQGEVYQVQSNTDLTGSKILALSNDTCKKVIVFSGSSFTSLGCSGAGSGDNLYEQLYPINTWGRNFVTCPFKSRVGDMLRVMAGSNGTTVSIDGVPRVLNQGQFHDTLLLNAAYITADKPITLAQYARTQSCDGNTGDPFMILLSPVEQSINNVLLYNSPEQDITGNYINVVMKTADIGTCLLDGNPITFNPVPFNPLYSYSQNTVADGSHTLVADSGFNATAYGFGSPESYGYLAGTNIRNLEYQTFTVNPQPACNGNVISFAGTASYEPDSWLWDFGDTDTAMQQNPTHVYADTGTYMVRLITTYPNGCNSQQDTSSYLLHIYGKPHADFTAPPVCLGDPTILTDMSTNISGSAISAWEWDMGNGSSASVQNTTHTYATCDTFSVKLIVTTDNGCTDSTTKNVVVHCLPTANFGAQTVCMNNATLFADSSFTDIAAWSWNFGDNSPVNNDSAPSHTYTTPGFYNTELTVTSTYGCTDSITRPVQVYHNPTAAFTFNDVCLGDSVYFSNTSSVDNSTSIDYYLWVFGDGSPSSQEQNPVHLFPAPGTYPVTLLVRTTDSCSNAISLNVNVYDAPVATFSVNNSCQSDSALFTNNTQNPTMGTIARWEWNFGDASPVDSTTWAPTHLYPAAGNYAVSLAVYSSNLGCSDTLKDSVTIYTMPLANFSATEVCLNTTTTFSDSSSVVSGTITAWEWRFGDGQNNNTQHPDHVYTGFGLFGTQLLVTTNNGCKDSITKNVTVHALPYAAFSAQNVCDNDTVIFNNTSSIPANPANDVINSWTWDFGDNSPHAFVQNTTHLYNDTGTYTVSLLITSDFGCADSVSKTVVVNPNPVVLFTATDTSKCAPLCVSFQNASFVPGGSTAGWLWSFGDNTPNSSSQDASHCYDNTLFVPVSYSPALTVTSDSGCVSVLTKNNYLTVFPNPNAQFIVSPQQGDITNPVIDITNTTVGTDTWSWDFGDTQTDSITNPPPHEYADTGVYTITLITSSSYGCMDTAYQTVIIEPSFLIYIPNAFTPNDDGVNDSFIPKSSFINTFSMSVFDRWGNLVYKTDSIDNPWNGKTKNGSETAQMDVYVYVINVTDFKMTKHSYKGTVTLIH